MTRKKKKGRLEGTENDVKNNKKKALEMIMQRKVKRQKRQRRTVFKKGTKESK